VGRDDECRVSTLTSSHLFLTVMNTVSSLPIGLKVYAGE